LIAFSYSSHEGVTAKGQYFDQFLGKTYNSQFLPHFDKFLEAAFGDIFYIYIIVIINLSTDKKTCDSRALSGLSPAPTSPAPTPPTQPENEHNSMGGTTRKAQGPSEYEKRRQANIEANKVLLASVGLGKGGVGILGESSKKKKRKISK
jgi:hypothetical protein